MGSESTTRPLSLSLALCVHVCVYTTPSRSLLSSLFSFSSREEEEEEKRGGETEKGEGKDGRSRDEGGDGAGREGLGIASCIGEHKCSRNNTIRRRARGTVSRVHALFVRRHAWLSPSRTRAVRREGIRKKGTGVRGPSRSSKRAWTRGVIRVPGTSANGRPIFICTAYTGRATCASRKSRRASAKGDSKVDLFLPSEVIQGTKYVAWRSKLADKSLYSVPRIITMTAESRCEEEFTKHF